MVTQMMTQNLNVWSDTNITKISLTLLNLFYSIKTQQVLNKTVWNVKKNLKHISMGSKNKMVTQMVTLGHSYVTLSPFSIE